MRSTIKMRWARFVEILESQNKCAEEKLEHFKVGLS